MPTTTHITRDVLSDGTVIKTYHYSPTRNIRCDYCGAAKQSHLVIVDRTHQASNGVQTNQHFASTVTQPCDSFICTWFRQ